MVSTAAFDALAGLILLVIALLGKPHALSRLLMSYLDIQAERDRGGTWRTGLHGVQRVQGPWASSVIQSDSQSE